MIRTVIKDHPKIDGRKSGQHTFLPRFQNSFFNGRNEVPRNCAAEDLIHKLEIAAARKWFHADFAVTVLARAAALLLMLALNIGFAFDRFAVRDFGRME